ncbi:MAG TPA: 3'(2'),5'-bisphosphate nucleotidase [Myxococcota bacterium]|nr:3'(2'),5'-bisphosphate nucleotidase [Myxococcota bacterium]
MASYEQELRAALEAVRGAARVCRAVQERLITRDTLEKRDKSPVTVADFASQAIVCRHLEQAFANDAVVGEEHSAELRTPENAALLASVVGAVSSEIGGVDAQRVLGWIDRGGADAKAERYWALDPIDGTKGFLRREQYAVALALIERGEVVAGALGCPNLDDGAGGTGVLLAAVRGQGAHVFPLWRSAGEGRPVHVSAIASPAGARFCESVEAEHSDQSESAKIAARLGITAPPLRMDSQCKYAAVARGDASIYLRLPTRADYREKIWDHAAGMLVVEEAGGRVSDVDGKPLDFRHGRTLAANRGVVATAGSIHARVIEAIREVRQT